MREVSSHSDRLASAVHGLVLLTATSGLSFACGTAFEDASSAGTTNDDDVGHSNPHSEAEFHGDTATENAGAATTTLALADGPFDDDRGGTLEAGDVTGDTEVWHSCPGEWRQLGHECLRVFVPLDWQSPKGPKIELFVARRLVAESKGEIWLLDGGPGSSGRALLQSAAATDTFDGYSLYLLSHRGTGHSTPLCCEGAGAGPWSEWDVEDCGHELSQRWGSALAHFGVRQAAFDLHHLIERWSDDEDGVVLYARSYGTYCAQHLLRNRPNQLQAIIFDGILDLRSEVWFNAVLADRAGRRIFSELCPRSPMCKAALGEDPEASVHGLFSRFAAPETLCPAFAEVRRGEFARMLGGLSFEAGSDPVLAPLAAGLVARLLRCNASDQQQLEHFLHIWQQHEPASGGSECRGSFTAGAYLNGLAQDLLAPLDAWPLEALSAVDEQLWFFESAELPIHQAVFEHWPRTGREPWLPLEGGLDSDLPMLLLQGSLDHQTVQPWAERVFARFDGPSQHAVVIETGGHGLVFGSHAFAEAGRCVYQLLQDFLEEPGAELDSACAFDTGLPDFEAKRAATRAASHRVFGSEDLYNVSSRDLDPAQIEPHDLRVVLRRPEFRL